LNPTGRAGVDTVVVEDLHILHDIQILDSQAFLVDYVIVEEEERVCW
jgi:hypothetical protein